jgi:tRNA nucleotidyltransferase (CCA-adding enzyme)
MNKVNNMRFYKVGGYVRDYLMGVRSQDVDWVVTGATEAELMASPPFYIKSFTKVGAEFPVYLSDQGDEWALARRERKSGKGYHGFDVEFGPEVTIEEDLSRRDLTINAMAIEFFDDAETRIMNIVDPFNGQEDMKNKVLRHTSDAFADDPVRVLRLARFRARFGSDWTVAPETAALVSQMAKRGVLNELTAERVWKELSRALMEDHARLFFDTLLECDALHVLFPEVYRLKTALEARRWHPEGDAYEHTMLVLTQAVESNFDLETRLACLAHDFGKGLTPRDQLPKHYGHEVTGVTVARDFCNRLTVPAKMRDRVMKTTRFHMHMHKLDTLNPKTWVHMFEDMDAFRDPEVVLLLWAVGVCDENGRLGSEDAPTEHLMKVRWVFDSVRAVKFADVFPNGEKNTTKIKEGMFKARVQAVKSA